MLEPRAAAAVGQSGLMSLYDAMFAQYGVKIAQVLVTKPDFYNENTRKNLFCTLSELIRYDLRSKADQKWGIIFFSLDFLV